MQKTLCLKIDDNFNTVPYVTSHGSLDLLNDLILNFSLLNSKMRVAVTEKSKSTTPGNNHHK